MNLPTIPESIYDHAVETYFASSHAERWADHDREPICGHCMDGWHGASVPWPCPTIRALDGEVDR